MNTNITLIEINLCYNSENKKCYFNNYITSIPKEASKKMNKCINKFKEKIKNLNFDLKREKDYWDKNDWEKVYGCYEERCINDEDCQFKLSYFCNEKCYSVSVEINDNFKNNDSYMDILNEIKYDINELWEKKVKPKIKMDKLHHLHFTYVEDRWSKKEFKRCKKDWEEVQKNIIDKPKDGDNTPCFACNCGTYWNSHSYVKFTDEDQEKTICPKCDTYDNPYLSNPINYRYVLKYIHEDWHDYIFMYEVPKYLHEKEESFEFINDNWDEEEYSRCYDEWEEVKQFISKEQTEDYCIECNTYWNKTIFICNPCPNCDTWYQPFLCNPINRENVLKYIDAKYHHYLIPQNQSETNSTSFLVKDNK